MVVFQPGFPLKSRVDFKLIEREVIVYFRQRKFSGLLDIRSMFW
jgi:hypothetical protein